jgi:hypothetical protein
MDTNGHEFSKKAPNIKHQHPEKLSAFASGFGATASKRSGDGQAPNFKS